MLKTNKACSNRSSLTYNEAYALFEAYLKEAVLVDESPERIIYEAMRYSLFAGGKRIRPALLLMANSLFEADTNACLPFSLAVEMIHTYSLIHDDLPCMDNDDLRRGKPTCHKAFSENTAVLAGDALLNLAFETMIRASKALKEPYLGLCAMEYLAKASGAGGMIGGQILDLQNETKTPDRSLLYRTYAKKTAALIRAPLMMGAVLGGATIDEIEELGAFGLSLGVAFQIQDDILDETASAKVLGKNGKSDEKNHKTTFVTLLGLEESTRLVGEYTQNALDCLASFGARGGSLLSLAQSLTERKY